MKRDRAKGPETAPDGFVDGRDAFLSFIELERGLARNTVVSYRRDLDQAANFFSRQGLADWKSVTADRAEALVHSLSNARYTVASLARKLAALRMLARHLVREKVRDDDFTALLTGPKPSR